MANNETKTNAEIYREQRKARLAKAAKKKGHGRNDKVIGILVKVVCILLVAAIVLYLVGSTLTNVFCLPQQVLTVAKYGDYKITVAEYNYFYMSLYNQAKSTADQYDQYYSGMGSQYFDTTTDPAEQNCPEADLPEGVVTWADYFAYCAPERAFLVKTLYDRAKSDEAAKAGFAISAEDQTSLESTINETMESYRQQAAAKDYAINNYLFKTFGEGVTENLFRELLEKEYVAELYLSWYQENATSNVNDADIEAYYTDNKADLDVVSVRVFGVSYAEVEEGSEDPQLTKEEAMAQAEEFAAKIAEGAEFTELAKEYAVPSAKEDYNEDSATLMKYQKKADLESISEGLGEWAFAADTQAKATKIFELEANQAVFVIMIETPAAKNETPSSVAVRHILIEVPKTTEADDGSTVDLPAETIEVNRTNALATVDKVRAELEEKGNTEEAFIELVSTYSNDTGSTTTGGLYEDINYTSSYVTEFLDWSLGDHDEGEIDVIETTYGYHIMYYVGGDTTPVWSTEIRDTLGTEAYEEYYLGLAKEIREGTSRNDTICNFFVKRTEEIVAAIVSNNASYASYY